METALTLHAATSPSALAEKPEAQPYRQPPHNLEAEQALLGAVLVNNEACDKVSGFLEPQHFFEPVHARIFEAVIGLVREGKLASPVTLKTFFERDAALNEIGGPVYLARLAAAAATVINAYDYGRLIYELARRRSLISLGSDMVNQSFDAGVETSAQELIETTEQALYAIAESGKYGRGFESFSEALAAAIEMAAAAHKRDGHLSGISCGLKNIDDKMGGLQPSDLIILAGRPAMGKTSLATNIAYHVAKAYRAEKDANGVERVADGGTVAFFSLEMSSEQLATRIISEQAQVSSEKIRRGQINQDEFSQLVTIGQELESLPLYIDSTGGLTVSQLAARARRLKRQRGLQLIVIDYLQLLTSRYRRASDSRVNELTEITTSLKALAKELNVPILALSQLSRQVESRDDKRPQLADLRESGSIEQDADVVLFIFREEYYLTRQQPRENTPEFFQWQEDMGKVHGLAEVIIGKQRHGPTGVIQLQFDAKMTRFSDLALPDHTPQRYGDDLD